MPGVLHWGPLIALSIIAVVTVASTYTALQLWGLPPSRVKYFRLPNFIFMYVWLILIMKNFYQALRGPGYVPLAWKPAKQSDEKYLQFCRVCQGYKPPRSHHCRQCKRCIKKMDHHCPWVNSCVGHDNHAAFTRFTFYVPFGCIHGVILNANFVYHLLTYDFILHQPYLTINTFWVIFSIASIGLGLGTAIGVFILFAVQLRSICNNRTQIEDWIIDKAYQAFYFTDPTFESVGRLLPRTARSRRDDDDDPFVFPYDQGCWKNYTQVINFSGKAKGDGIHWPLKEGCSEYDFTIEQLEQKKLKKHQSITCRVKKDYSGAMCPLGFGLMTCLCAPKCDDGKIAVKCGDIMTVTRWRTFWVYGDKHLPQADVDQGKRVRGWFPRRCVKAIDGSANDKGNDNQDPVKAEKKGSSDSTGGKGVVTDPVKKKAKKGSEDAGVKRTVRKREPVKND